MSRPTTCRRLRPAKRTVSAGCSPICPPGQREALTLRFVDGMTLGEIAQVLDIPLGTVKSRLHLGIAALKSSPLARELLE